jgi:hypothetical protein
LIGDWDSAKTEGKEAEEKISGAINRFCALLVGGMCGKS